MNKSSPKFIAFLTLSILSVTSEANDAALLFLPSNDFDYFRLWCLLFKNIGCDLQCYVMNRAFGKLAGGYCDDDKTCRCTGAKNPSLVGLWKEKFRFSEVLLGKIQANSELSSKALATLAAPYKTALQTKEMLKEEFSLSEEEYNQIQVTDPNPATQMIPTLNQINLPYIEKFVDDTLSEELESRKEELSEIELETVLLKVLNDNIDKYIKFQKLKWEIRQFRNTYLNSFLSNYLTENHKGECTPDENGTNGNHDGAEINKDAGPKAVNIIDTISNIIVDRLVKKRTSPDGWIKWIGKKVTNAVSSLLSLSSQPPDKVDIDKVLNDSDFFKLPSIVDGKRFKKSKPIDKTWRDDTFTLRYRGERKKTINLIWMKNPVRISILKTEESNVSQNWFFGTKVKIHMYRTVGRDPTEIWDLGTAVYHSDKTWEYGAPDEISLLGYKAAIRNWCDNNKVLIDKDDCVIFK